MYTRQDRLEQVYNVVSAADAASGVSVTRREVCKWVGLRNSPYLVGMLDELVGHGYIVEERVMLPGRTMPTVFYSLPKV